ncbi:acyltransferase [Spirosoma sp. KNUC1025]|uniref:acyltransferase family protein n=1 Tax=Spirosoma sp. KNUC1025 TaxID=2894082 RepID=UPI00386BA930|nr:acyltransferase [Spirosoma sp. KNUC1025]
MDNIFKAESGHKNNFDFVRFILAVLVVFSHCYVIYYGNVSEEPFEQLSKGQLALGTFAVNCFFIISGFLITQSWERSENFLAYLKKRVLRIYPGFIVVCFAGAYIFAPLGLYVMRYPEYMVQYWSYIDVPDLILTTLRLGTPLLPATFKNMPWPNVVNGSLWSIPYEFVCYLIIPLLFFSKRKFTLWTVIIIAIGCNIYDYNIYHKSDLKEIWQHWFIPVDFQFFFNNVTIKVLLNFEHVVYPFIAGIFFYTYRNYIPSSIYLVILSIIILSITIYIGKYFEIMQPIFGSYLLFYFVFNPHITFHNFAKYGDFSYGVYLYGWPVQQLVTLYFGDTLTVWGIFFISMLFTLPLAALSWYFIEKPFLSLKKKKLKVVSLDVAS